MSVVVVIPVFGKPDVLLLALDALAMQSHPAFTVVMVDQGGSIDGRAVMERFAGRLELRYLDAPAGTTVSEKRNMAIRATDEDIVVFLDADTIVCPDFIREHLAMQGAGHEAVLGYIYGKQGMRREEVAYTGELSLGAFFDWFRPLASKLPDEREKYYEPVQDRLMRLAWPWVTCWSGNLSVSRGALRAAGGFDSRFRGWGFEDIELGYRLIRAGCGLALSRSAWAVHVPHDVDEARREREHTANARRFLGKYPSLMNEASILKIEAILAATDGEERSAADATDYSFLFEEASASCAASMIVIGYERELAEMARTTVILEPRPDRLPELAAHGKKVYPLAGVFTPFESGEFDACVVTPVWTSYARGVLAALLTETMRIARVSYFLCRGEEALVLLAAINYIRKLGSRVDYCVDRRGEIKVITCRERFD